jgi:hypothetical protein
VFLSAKNIGTANNTLKVQLGLTITNPTYLKFEAPSLPFDLIYGNQTIGTSILSPLVLNPNVTNERQGNSLIVKDG